MTDTQDLSHLRALAAEWLDRGCDVDDLRCEGGSTSVNKLMRAYVAATEPTKVIDLLDKLKSAQAEIERLNAGWKDANTTLVKQYAELNDTHIKLNAALARIAELEKQEPVEWRVTERGNTSTITHAEFVRRSYDCATFEPRYATAGASPVQPSQAGEFNNAINFAIEQGLGCSDFLRAWREGDASEWPEFDAKGVQS